DGTRLLGNGVMRPDIATHEPYARADPVAAIAQRAMREAGFLQRLENPQQGRFRQPGDLMQLVQAVGRPVLQDTEDLQPARQGTDRFHVMPAGRPEEGALSCHEAYYTR